MTDVVSLSGPSKGVTITPKSVPSTLLALLKPGDIILTGHGNWFSAVSRFVTGSRFGHVMIYRGDRRFIEATDVKLTPVETDEGIFPRGEDEFADRIERMVDVRVLRPHSLDRDAFVAAVDHVVDHSPPYPSVGTILMGFACFFSGPTQSLPATARERVVRFQHRIVADGTSRMHCSELAYRLYRAIGVPIVLHDPVLPHLLTHGRSRRAELLPLPDRPRIAEIGRWSRNPIEIGAMATVRLASAVKDRFDPSVERDVACYVTPEDLARSPSFRTVIDLRRRSYGWQLLA